jgi:uncharacterized membrane protein YfcA
MEIGIGALLFGAGLAGGVANAMAGGATLITFPAMIAGGLPPIVANASNAVAVTPGHVVAALADRARLPRFDRALGLALAASLVGGAVGAVLLLATPERLFTLLVPALIGIATLVFALGHHVRRDVVDGARSDALRCALLVPMSIYGGYFGGGSGVMYLAVLVVTGREDVRQANVLKNLLASVVSAVTIAIFVMQGVVSWPETIVMLVGAVAGGFLGGRLIAVLNPATVRSIVVVAGTAMTLVYAWRYWV